MDYEKQIETLRLYAGKNQKYQMAAEAADSLEQLVAKEKEQEGTISFLNEQLAERQKAYSRVSAERDELTAENAMLRKMQPVVVDGEGARSFALALECSELKAERDRLQAELDACKGDIEYIMQRGGRYIDTCQFCKTDNCYNRAGAKLCHSEWRGKEQA